MAVPRKLPVAHADVFPAGAYLKGDVTPVYDFDATKDAPAGTPKVQAIDVNKAGEGTGLLMWQVTVIDADETAGKKNSAITVKFAAAHQPVPPTNTTPFPFTPVEFVGLTISPYVETSGGGKDGKLRHNVAFSLRAEGMTTPSAVGSGSRASRRNGAEGEQVAA